ncbi:MAG: hypothetical protein PHG31_05905 [Candidatus Omnitrophica bacterium]|nr:hypothetical protein [Candidatus Omnitrophota bacterium]
MENKGLCVSCVYDKTCTFNRKFPVLQCEEFSDCGSNGKFRPTKSFMSSPASVKSCPQEETIAE